jgi:hypothetical protein
MFPVPLNLEERENMEGKAGKDNAPVRRFQEVSVTGHKLSWCKAGTFLRTGLPNKPLENWLLPVHIPILENKVAHRPHCDQ